MHEALGFRKERQRKKNRGQRSAESCRGWQLHCIRMLKWHSFFFSLTNTHIYTDMMGSRKHHCISWLGKRWNIQGPWCYWKLINERVFWHELSDLTWHTFVATTQKIIIFTKKKGQMFYFRSSLIFVWAMIQYLCSSYFAYIPEWFCFELKK